MLSPNLFNTLFVFPILNLLVVFYKVFLFLKIPGAFGFAVIALTAAIRLLLHPFFKQFYDTNKKMQEIKPHLDRLSAKHKKDPKVLQQEQLRLYKEAGINPASGCLFAIIQIPIFFALYNTLSLFLRNGNGVKVIAQINKALYTPLLQIQTIDPQFIGFNLALSPAKAGVWYYYLIPVLTGVLQYLQVHLSTPKTQKTEAKPDSDLIAAENKNMTVKQKDEEKKSNSEDFQKIMNTQMKFIFPVMIGWFSYSLPVGLSLYWNIFSLFSIIQYRNAHKKK